MTKKLKISIASALVISSVAAYSVLSAKEVNDVSIDSPHPAFQLEPVNTQPMVKDYLASSMAYSFDSKEFLMTSDHPHKLFADPISTLMVLADDLITVKQTLDIPSDSDLEGLTYAGDDLAIAISEKGTIYRLQREDTGWSLLDSKKGLAGKVTKVASLAANLEDGKLYSAEKEGDKNLYVMDMQGQLEKTIKLSLDNPKGDYSLDDDYTISGLAFQGNDLYILSEAYSTIFKFDIRSEKIVAAYGLKNTHEVGGLTIREGNFVTAGDVESYLPDPVISEFYRP